MPNKPKILRALVLPGFFLLIFFALRSSLEKNSIFTDKNNTEKNIILSDDNYIFFAKTKSVDIKSFLSENKITLGEKDYLNPSPETKIYSGINIHIERAKKISIIADGKTSDFYTFQKTIGNAISESKITLGPLDKIFPDKNSPVQDNLKITITRINIEEKIIPEDIDYKITYKNNDKLSWREEKVETPGENGIRETKYKITYKDGKEISRIKLSSSIKKDPTSQIVSKGTYVKLGDSHSGLGTWYAFKGGLFAASPWLPIGSYAKVTNPSSGKSVIVQINDRGPFGKNRIIDLDKVAFQKIAPLGAGVINVKVEEVLN